MDRQTLTHIRQSIARRKAVAVVTWLVDGRQLLVEPATALAEPDLRATVDEAFRRDRSMTATVGGADIFIDVHNPPLRLVALGAVHIAQALIPMALQAGYDITIIDPRTAFATAERFPGVDLVAEWPDEVLPRLGLDRRTAFLALTHDPKIDDPGLHAALASDCFYVGALGSRRTHATRCERLTASGVSADQLARIHAPIGLDIGAEGPVEIAISIVAEMTAVLRGRERVSS